MTIGMIEVSNRRAALLSARAVKKLKEQRKETRAVMQRFEGVSDLPDDERTTYEHLTLSMVILNALSDQLLKCHFLPRSWDDFTLGSDFDKSLTPLLRKNDNGELWVEFFDCDRPKSALLVVAGHLANPIAEGAPALRRRPAATEKPVRNMEESVAEDSSLMDMIRMRMPDRYQTRYQPRRG